MVIVSDSLFSGSSNFDKDTSGHNAVSLLSEAGIHSINMDYFPDDFTALKAKVDDAIFHKIDLLIFIGGTGLDPRDVTIESVTSSFSKEIPGYGEEFRRRSVETIKERGLLSRAVAGVVNNTLVVCLPGSPNAVETGISLLLPMLGHALKLIRREHKI